MKAIGILGCVACLAAGLLAQQQTPQSIEARRAAARRSLRGPAERQLIYVTLPGTLEGSPDRNGSGIVVLDARNNYNFVKRIQTWESQPAATPNRWPASPPVPSRR
jgi:hypothetical protein